MAKNRRTIAQVVTEERMQREARLLDRVFAEVWYSLPPPQNKREELRRIRALKDSARKVLLAAFAYLAEYNAPVRRALVGAGRRYAEEAIRGDTAQFVVRHSAAKKAPDFQLKPALVGLHRWITQRLKESWRPPDGAGVWAPHRFVSPTRRYGEEQKIGTRRRFIQHQQRVRVVLDTLSFAAKEAEIAAPNVTAKQVGDWLRKNPSPARTSLWIIATLVGKTPRQIKEELAQARRYLKEAREQRQIIDLWNAAPPKPRRNQSSAKTHGHASGQIPPRAGRP